MNRETYFTFFFLAKKFLCVEWDVDGLGLRCDDEKRRGVRWGLRFFCVCLLTCSRGEFLSFVVASGDFHHNRERSKFRLRRLGRVWGCEGGWIHWWAWSELFDLVPGYIYPRWVNSFCPLLQRTVLSKSSHCLRAVDTSLEWRLSRYGGVSGRDILMLGLEGRRGIGMVCVCVEYEECEDGVGGELLDSCFRVSEVDLSLLWLKLCVRLLRKRKTNIQRKRVGLRWEDASWQL